MNPCELFNGHWHNKHVQSENDGHDDTDDDGKAIGESAICTPTPAPPQ